MASSSRNPIRKPLIHRTSKQFKSSHLLLRDLFKKRTQEELIRNAASQTLSAMTAVEAKEKKVVHSKDGPTVLGHLPAFEYIHTSRSLSMQNAFRSMFGTKVYPFRLSTALNMSSSGAGIVNSTINMSVVQSSTDFSSFATIFQEFFIVKCTVNWQPVSRYNYPLTAVVTPTPTSVSSLPFVCAQLQHAATVYTSMSSALNNYDAKYHSTGDPFTYHWVNVETPDSKVETTTSGTQSWCDTSSGQLYTGAIQFLSQSAPPGLPTSQVLGTFATHFDVLFRVRE
jgi:hypothetical protein